MQNENEFLSPDSFFDQVKSVQSSMPDGVRQYKKEVDSLSQFRESQMQADFGQGIDNFPS